MAENASRIVLSEYKLVSAGNDFDLVVITDKIELLADFDGENDSAYVVD